MNPGLPEERSFTIAHGVVTIGRTKENAIHCLHKSISRKHAQLQYDGATVRLIDLGSRSGVYFNGRRVATCDLSLGDQFRCGDITFLVKDPTAPRWSSGDYAPGAQTLPSPFALEPRLGRRPSSAPPAEPTSEAASSRFKDKLFLLIRASELCVSGLPLERLLEELVVLAVHGVELDRLVLLTRDDESGKLRPRLVRSFVGPSSEPYSKRVVDWVEREGRAATFGDVSTDRALPGDAAVDLDVRGALGVPLNPGTGTVGVLYADSTSRRDCFRPDDLAFLRALANLAALAIASAPLRTRSGGANGSRERR